MKRYRGQHEISSRVRQRRSSCRNVHRRDAPGGISRVYSVKPYPSDIRRRSPRTPDSNGTGKEGLLGGRLILASAGALDPLKVMVEGLVRDAGDARGGKC